MPFNLSNEAAIHSTAAQCLAIFLSCHFMLFFVSVTLVFYLILLLYCEMMTVTLWPYIVYDSISNGTEKSFIRVRIEIQCGRVSTAVVTAAVAPLCGFFEMII